MRKVKACRDLLLKRCDLLERHREQPEDVFFSYCGSRADVDFNLAPINVAYAFSAEINLVRSVKKNGGKLPFGCHRWHKLNTDFYAEIFLRFGWDLRPLKDKLADGEAEFILQRALTIVALYRLDRRVRNGRTLLRYLPTNRFDTVVVVRDEMTPKILEQLLREEKFFADKICFCDADSVEKIFARLPSGNVEHLFIGAGEPCAVRDKKIISFRREYLASCEKIFHALGR